MPNTPSAHRRWCGHNNDTYPSGGGGARDRISWLLGVCATDALSGTRPTCPGVSDRRRQEVVSQRRVAPSSAGGDARLRVSRIYVAFSRRLGTLILRRQSGTRGIGVAIGNNWGTFAPAMEPFLPRVSIQRHSQSPACQGVPRFRVCFAPPFDDRRLQTAVCPGILTAYAERGVHPAVPLNGGVALHTCWDSEETRSPAQA